MNKFKLAVIKLKGGNTLIYDSDVTGHHIEFLINTIKAMPSDNCGHLFLLVNHEIIPNLKVHLQSYSEITFLKIESGDFEFSTKRIFFRSNSFTEIKALEILCKRHFIDRLILMSMNKYQFALMLCMRKRDIQIRGIIFNPYLPLSRSRGFWSKFRSLLFNARKIFQYKCMLSNQAVARMFLLNDEASVDILNRIFSRKRPFELLVDPLPFGVHELHRRFLNTPKADTPFVFLMFGAMGPRKGVLEVLKAIKIRGEIFPKKAIIRIVGKFSSKCPEWQSDVLAEANWINSHLESIKVDIIDEFVSFPELYEFLQASHCVLAPYIKHSGSSGVIGHACLMECPLVVASGGLMAEVVSKFGIGVIVEPDDCDAMISVLRKMMIGNFDYDVEGAKAYADMADYNKFGKTLFKD
ncbi:MAG: glycosyltransferase involved in cell wall biosynthesis [Candidatus Endobugula sp.]